MRLLITGGSSYLGQHLVPLAQESHNVTYTYFQNDPLHLPLGRQLDIRDKTAVSRLITTLRPDTIIHTVGSNRAADYDAVIVQGARHVAAAATAVGARLIHLSTDSIFDGLHPPYDESALPSPVNAYGAAKARAEAIASAHAPHVIVRTSLIYGLNLMDHGTVWMARALKAGKPVTLFDNQVRNPVWAITLSSACLELAGNDFTGVLNVAGRQVLTRAAFARKMLDWWGIYERKTLTIGPATGRQWPLNCELVLDRAIALLQTPLIGVDKLLHRG